MTESETAATRLRRVAPALSVGVLTADLLNLGAEICMLEEEGVRVLHFDVMDGCYCPMLTIGAPVIKAVRTSMLKDVHLMIVDPMPKLDAYVNAGADIVTIQVESCRHPYRVLQALGEMENANDPTRGIVRGIGLNPGTPLEVVRPLLEEIDMVLLLAVNPGWSGQRFISTSTDRVTDLIGMIRASGRDILICLDGGAKRDNICDLIRSGADLVVTGSAVFDGKTPRENVRSMLDEITGALAV